jgi:Mg-chelatase subunit ChlD
MTIGGDGPVNIDFWVDHDGKKYQSLVVEFENEWVYFSGITRSQFGHYKRNVRHKSDCRIEHGSEQEIFDIPQYAGLYKWRVHSKSKIPQKVKVSLVHGPPLPALKDGPGLGAIRVRNLPYGSIHLEPEWQAGIDHPDYKSHRLRADRTSGGDAILWVPSGYWKVNGTPPENAGLTSAVAHMIPVHAGRVTNVDWPRSISGRFAPQGVGRLEILDARHRETLGEVDVSLMELDADMVPKKDLLNCYEGGLAGNVISVEPLKTPLNVVLLLDSSGSMKKSMSQALDSVKNFVGRFPEDAHITIVDFDTKPKILPSDSRAELLKSLDNVRPDGATALYDSILLGLEKLKAKDRRALVVFTDGVDANWDDTGPGSKATQPEVIKAVENAGIPIFTIGFGKNPDVDTLTRVATLSGGSYYEAHDRETLDAVFARISDNLGRHYRVTYERPRAAGLSDVPVMALVVDNSGSMDLDPARKGCGYRIQKVRRILKAFSLSLPDKFMIQLLTFSDDTRVGQVLTTETAFLLRGLSVMQGNGGTDILGSTRAALETLKSVPSSRRYLVYLADAAMQVKKKDQEELDILLAGLNDEGIQCLFVGVVDNDEGGAFAHAATLSGGRHVISTDLEKVSAVFDEVLGQIAATEEKETRTALRLTLTDRDERGRNRVFSAGRFVDFSKLPVSDEIVSPEALVWSIGEPLIIYDNLVASTVSGSDRPAEGVSVAKRIPLEIESKKEPGIDAESDSSAPEYSPLDLPGITGRNSAMEISALEMVFLSRLKDISPPAKHRFLVLPLKMTNILEPQRVAVYKDGSRHPAAWMAGAAAPERYEEEIPPYLIPDLTRHMFLCWNEETTIPVSPVTWLCEEPLLTPGERALSIQPDQPVIGACAFLVPDAELTQASLHFFDVNYGNIDIPLTGMMPERPKETSELPATPGKKLGSSFTLTISNVKDQDDIAHIPAGEDFVFRVIEGYLTSQIQALLTINPAERITYHLPSEKGDFVFTLNAATEFVPMGFYRPTMVAPGARNVIRMAFRMPREQAALSEKGYLFVDVFGGGVHLDVADATSTSGELGQAAATGQGIDLFVNGSGVLDKPVAGKRGNFVAVDVTFREHPDRSHTRLGHLVVLKKKGTGAADWGEHYGRRSSELHKIASKPHRGLGDFGKVGVGDTKLVTVTGASMAKSVEDKLIFGLDEKSVIFDGQIRRGVMLFDFPKDEKIEDWEISSWVLENVSLPLSGDPFGNAVMLSERLEIKDDIGSGFWDKLEKKVRELQAQRAARGHERPGNVMARPVDLDTADLGKQPIPVPGVSSPGASALKEVSNIEDIWKLISALSWVPGQPRAWSQRYAPEAVLTQGWGDPSDLASLAERLMNEQGVITVRAAVKPTERGRLEMAKEVGADKLKIDSLPALRYTDAEREHLMVFPWCREIDQLDGLVTWEGDTREPAVTRQKIRVQVKLEIESIASQQSTGSTRVAASALAGGNSVSKTKWVTVLDETFFGDEASLDALDIGYTEFRKDGHPTLQVVIDGPKGRQMGREGVYLDQWAVKNEWIGINMDGGPWKTAQQPVDPDRPITGRFHILSVNAPDLDVETVEQLESLRKERHARAGEPDGLSALRWYGRSVIDRFIAAQTRFEKQTAEKLGLTIGRSLNGRCILVTVQRPDTDADPSTRVDLLHVANDIHGCRRPDRETAEHAFNIISGLAAARFEAAAIPGGGIGLFELWEHCPEGTQLAFIDNRNKRAFTDMLKEKGFQEPFVKYLNDCKDAILFPTNPAIINGEARWGWLEIDPKTYRVVSRLDNGAAGAMIEGIIGNLFQQATSYLVGALVGIDVSLWSVSLYSLQLEDYDAICEKAYGFAANFSKKFSVSEEITGPVGWDIGGSPDVELIKFDRAVKFSLDFKGIQASNNMLGFKNGYNDAVAYYFSD